MHTTEYFFGDGSDLASGSDARMPEAASCGARRRAWSACFIYGSFYFGILWCGTVVAPLLCGAEVATRCFGSCEDGEISPVRRRTEMQHRI
jgi:hypothetical protein